MSLAALDRLEDAFDATTALLVPVDGAQWLRLAVAAFFIGGLGGVSGGTQVGGGDVVGGLGSLPGLAAPDSVGPELVGVGLVVLGLAAAAALLGLAVLYVGSVMEFVLLAALETRTVSLRDRFGVWRWPGTRLFCFRLALFAGVALLVAGAAGLGLLLQGPGLRVLALLFAVPVAIVVVPLGLLVNGLTTVFVVPTMYVDRCGVLAGWRRLWPRLRAAPWETLAYICLSVVFSVAGGTAIATAVGLVAAALVVPVGVAGIALVVGGAPAVVTLAVLVPLLVSLGLVVAALAAVFRVPVLVYLRHYALFVLADLDGPDLFAGVREATDVRPPGEYGDASRPT